jgi:hypothetical protein
MLPHRNVRSIGVVLLLCTSGCAGLCGNHILTEETSPDNRRSVVIFERDCGATTGISIQVSVLSAPERLADEGGNVFIEDDNRGVSKPWAKVRWLSQDRIAITYPSQSRVFRKETLVMGVGVTYEPVP